MKKVLITAIISFLVLACGNIIWQIIIFNNLWSRVVALSLLQLITIVMFVLVYNIVNLVLSANDG
mgnify:FL=1